ncbi:hypothetical protein Gotri_003496, partial [Gossypium trilobum]|nr:hypothetical protein [Gossypium trilobum]
MRKRDGGSGMWGTHQALSLSIYLSSLAVDILNGLVFLNDRGYDDVLIQIDNLEANKDADSLVRLIQAIRNGLNLFEVSLLEGT